MYTMYESLMIFGVNQGFFVCLFVFCCLFVCLFFRPVSGSGLIYFKLYSHMQISNIKIVFLFGHTYQRPISMLQDHLAAIEVQKVIHVVWLQVQAVTPTQKLRDPPPPLGLQWSLHWSIDNTIIRDYSTCRSRVRQILT